MQLCVNRLEKLSALSRALTTAVKSTAKSYSSSLLLPKTTFPQWSDPKASEAPFRQKTCDDLYSWQKANAKGPLFVTHDGPPYANGSIHMGHALNKIVKDMITRFHLLRGRRVNYMPGWDCHGLPIENKTLKELKRRADSLPPNVLRLSAKAVAEREVMTQREDFRELGVLADWSKEGTYRTLDRNYEINQLHLFERMVEKGLIYRSYRPVHYSPSSRSALAEAELTYREDHVSRSVYITFRLLEPTSTNSTRLKQLWDGCRGSVKLVVWTTTPWTLPANMGIAVNADMTYSVLETSVGDRLVIAKDRLAEIFTTLELDCKKLLTIQGSELIGFRYSPLFPSTSESAAPFQIIPAAFVTSETGTGLVHCAPAHGAEDYAAFRSLGLLQDQHPKLLCYVDGEGRFSDDIADVTGENLGKRLSGLSVLDKGTDAIIELLQQTDGVLLKEERITHRYPYDWKTDKPIIVTATSQWFASLDSIKKTALEALKNVTFYPPESRRRLESFIASRSEWCISRQRVWGVPIPTLHHIPSGDVVLDTSSLAHIISVLEREGPEHWWTGSVADFVPEELRKAYATPDDPVAVEKDWTKGTDTMDVWFDSGSSWAMLRDQGIQSESEGVLAYADVCIEGSDQHRGWFQSMLLTAMATAPVASPSSPIPILPYRALVTHGMVLDQEGKKMSKSLGNIISPMVVVFGGKDKKREPAYGADVLRFWAASVEYWRDTPLGPTVLAQSAESLRKIRNSARFILGNIGDEESRKSLVRVDVRDMSIADRYVLRELQQLEESVLASYDQLNFPRAVQAISRFANTTLSAFYFDITKDILYADKRDSVQRRSVVSVLEKVLEQLTCMIAPITPHLAEEIFYHQRGAQGEKSAGPSVFTKQWIELPEDHLTGSGKEDAKDMGVLLKARDAVLSLLEQARGNKNLRSSLEAQVNVVVHESESGGCGELAATFSRHEDFLKTLFIVSDVTIGDKRSSETNAGGWMYSSILELPGLGSAEIRVSPAGGAKCPRCWTYTRAEDEDLCGRCAGALATP